MEADDPELSVRHVTGADPVKIVLDSTLSIQTTAKVFEGETLVVVGKEGIGVDARTRVKGAGAEVWLVPAGQDGPPVSEGCNSHVPAPKT